MQNEELLSLEEINTIIDKSFLKATFLQVLVEDYPLFYKHENIENVYKTKLGILEKNDPFVILETKVILEKNNIIIWLHILKKEEIFWISFIECENDESCLNTSLFISTMVMKKWNPKYMETNLYSKN